LPCHSCPLPVWNWTDAGTAGAAGRRQQALARVYDAEASGRKERTIRRWNKVGGFSHNEAVPRCHKAVLCSGRMEPSPPPRPSFSLAGAGMTLIGSTAAVIIIAALIGWAFGSFAWGFLVGAILGIPVGVATVIGRYGKAI
jgi:hypothetical protein